MKKVDKSLIISTSTIIMLLVIFITLFNDSFVGVVDYLNKILSYELGFYYIIVGILSISMLILIALSKYGKIKLGDKKEYSDFAWSSMIFTATMAADIIFFSWHEWMYYYQNYKESYLSSQSQIIASSTYPLFHWGFIPWSFYMLPAIAYAFFSYKNKKECYRLSHACYPLIKSKIILKVIDIIGIVGLMIAVSTTFSLATPLLSGSISRILGISNSRNIVMITIIIIGIIYSADVLSGLNGISNVAKFSTYVFFLFLALVMISENLEFTINNGISSIGNLIQNHVGMSFYISESGFTRDWTIFYWAYWIAWSVATPFFIARISRGRTIREVAVKGTIAGVAGTFVSFIILGNASISEEIRNGFTGVQSLIDGADTSEVIIDIISNMHNSNMILIIMIVLMIMLYATTIDSIIYTVSNYSYNNLVDESSKKMRIFWSVLFLALPLSLVFLDSTMNTLKTLSIILAFPISIIMIIVVSNFIKSLKGDIH